jgi:hypothetical protein
MMIGKVDDCFVDSHKCSLEDAHMGLLFSIVMYMKNFNGILMNS